MSDTESTQLSESSGEGSHYSSQETEIGGGTDLENQSESSSETETSMPGPYILSPVILIRRVSLMGVILQLMMVMRG